MINKKIAIIAHFMGDQVCFDGQTIKSREVEKIINKKNSEKITRVDTHHITKNIFKLFFKTKKILKENDVIIIMVSSRGYMVFLPIITLLNKFYKKKVYDFVVGSRYEIYKNVFIRMMAKKINKIYVEAVSLKEKYNDLGLKNVEVLPNFKDIKIYPDIPNYQNNEKLKICTFSRICKEKGIEDAINAVVYANNSLKKDSLHLDIYGPLQDGYEETFEKLRCDFPEYIQYKGIADYNSSSGIIKDYDLMLFLTYWPGEGFPGTLIDSLSASVPTIATDWSCNFDVLEDKYTAYKVPIKSYKEVGEKLIYCYNNQKEIYNMKRNCIEEAYKYLPDNVIEKFLKEIEG